MTSDAPINKRALPAVRDALRLLGEHVEQESGGEIHGFGEVDASLDALASSLTQLFPWAGVPGVATLRLDEVLRELAAGGWVDENVVALTRRLLADVRRTRYFRHTKQDIFDLEGARRGLHQHLTMLLTRAERSAEGV